MQENILQSSDVTKVYLSYCDGKGFKKRVKARLRFIDKKSCYFSSDSIINYNKPRWRTKTKIIVYTADGVYTSEVIIRNVTYSLTELMFELTPPKTWNYKQLRASSRKAVDLPVKLTFSDNYEIETIADELSMSGFRITYDKQLTTVQKGFPANLKLEFPELDKQVIETKVKYVRDFSLSEDDRFRGYNKVVFKFLNLRKEDLEQIKNYLIAL